MVGGTTTTTTTTTHMHTLQDPTLLYTTNTVTMTDSQPESSVPVDSLPAEEETTSTSCLFCTSKSNSVEANYQHMHKNHGFFIPSRDHLIVDLDTLFKYISVVIFEDNECPYCHTERRSVQAIQHHMLDARHCKFDIVEEDSEFRDFYGFDLDGDDDDSDTELEVADDTQLQVGGAAAATTIEPVQVDEESMRLPSGRVVSNRSAPARRHPGRKPLRPRSTSPKTLQTQPLASSETPAAAPSSEVTEKDTQKPSKSMIRQERRSRAIASQLYNLSTNDQRALAHLTNAQQRSVLAQGLRQNSQLDRSEREFRGHMDSHGNLKSKERFVNDVPGGKAHKNRFFAR